MSLREKVGQPNVAVASRVVVNAEGHVAAHAADEADAALKIDGGGALKTWSYRAQSLEQMQVTLTNEGGPIDAKVQLWQGPADAPLRMRVFSEDGRSRPFRAMLESPLGENTVLVRNVEATAFPVRASVVGDKVVDPSHDALAHRVPVQGQGSARTFPLAPGVDSVQVLLMSNGRPLNARVEVLQGPDDIKQIVQLHSQDGVRRPPSP